uniref:Uncharacterized protein n=1 Tax=Sphaeramia orbicularis TaxID=375764 RepID=A0A673CEI1_9TELE
MLQGKSTDGSGSRFTPLVVLELVSDTKEEAIAWLLGRIRDRQQDGGWIRRPLPISHEKDNPNIFLVGASWQRLLSGAEDLGLFKEFNDGSMRAFTCANKHNFKDFNENSTDIVTTNQQLFYLLDTLRAKDETHIPGYTQAKLYPGKSISE